MSFHTGRNEPFSLSHHSTLSSSHSLMKPLAAKLIELGEELLSAHFVPVQVRRPTSVLMSFNVRDETSNPTKSFLCDSCPHICLRTALGYILFATPLRLRCLEYLTYMCELLALHHGRNVHRGCPVGSTRNAPQAGAWIPCSRPQPDDGHRARYCTQCGYEESVRDTTGTRPTTAGQLAGPRSTLSAALSDHAARQSASDLAETAITEEDVARPQPICALRGSPARAPFAAPLPRTA